jgi:hypothetical protein
MSAPDPGWSEAWLARHCKGSGRGRCRMVDSSSSTTASGTNPGTGPRVANRHHFGGRKLPPRAVYVGRGSPLGNPYTRDVPDALGEYRRWLWAQLRVSAPSVVGMLSRVRPDALLVCSCWPRPCHADVIRAAWWWMRDQGLLVTEAGS